MVTKYGFYEDIGLINYSKYSNDNYSEKIQNDIDNKVKEILSNAYNRGKLILKSNESELKKIAEYLLEKEVIYGEDIKRLIPFKSNTY